MYRFIALCFLSVMMQRYEQNGVLQMAFSYSSGGKSLPFLLILLLSPLRFPYGRALVYTIVGSSFRYCLPPVPTIVGARSSGGRVGGLLHVCAYI